MGFGVSGLINKFTRQVLIRWGDTESENFLEGWRDNKAITPDVKKSETHGYQSNVTQMAVEDGSIIAEHVIQQPITVSAQFEETNNTVKRFDKALGSLGIEKKSTFDKLVEIWEKKILCQVITEHKIYYDMVIQNMPIQHRAPYRGALSITCEFTQLNFAAPIRSIFVGKDAGLSKSASQTVNGGTQKMKSLIGF